MSLAISVDACWLKFVRPLNIVFLIRRGKRGRESVILGRDLEKLMEKCEKRFTKMMQERYGIGIANFHRPKVKLECGQTIKDMNPKKLQMLSSLLFSSISDIMQSGEVLDDNEIVDNLQISKIDLSKNLHCLKIFWVASGTEEDFQIQNVLDNCVPSLRNSLMQLDFVGFVPKIEFVRDLSEAKLAEFTRILEKADTGCPLKLSPLQETIMYKHEITDDSSEILKEHLIKKLDNTENAKCNVGEKNDSTCINNSKS